MAILKGLFLSLLTSTALVCSSNNSAISILLNYNELNKIDNEIREGSFGKVSGLMILNKNGRIIHERYYGFSNKNTIHPISSVTKSLTSILVGVCLEKGYIKSIDQPIWTYFPEYSAIFNKDTLKKSITLRHLLNQTAGLKWEEWKFPYNYVSNSLIALLETDANWVEHFFNLPVESYPGTKFSYNSLSSQVIAEVLSRASGVSFDELTKEYLFKPLSINTYFWDNYPSNNLPAWGGIALTTMDMAKIGLVVLNEGTPWGKRIVSKEWIDESTKNWVAFNDSIGYALHWWVGHQPDGNRLIYAAGYGDQFVFIAPDKEIVISINSQNFSDYRWPKSVEELANSILSSISYIKS